MVFLHSKHTVLTLAHFFSKTGIFLKSWLEQIPTIPIYSTEHVMLDSASAAESNVREEREQREKAKQSSHQAMTVVHHCVINQGVKSLLALCRSSY